MNFDEVWDHVRTRSAMSVYRAERLWWYAQAVRDIPGHVAEIGVYGGASLYLLARAFEGTGKVIYGFDTFAGFPSIGDNESGYVGEMAYPEDHVAEFVAHLPVKLLKGPIETRAVPDMTWVLVHVDCDLESCYRASLRKFWPNITRGGVMVMDDYGFGRWPGATKVADEFFDATEYRIEGMRGDDWNTEVRCGADWSFVQGVVRKIR
jgi:O-methyltransferase